MRIKFVFHLKKKRKFLAFQNSTGFFWDRPTMQKPANLTYAEWIWNMYGSTQVKPVWDMTLSLQTVARFETLPLNCEGTIEEVKNLFTAAEFAATVEKYGFDYARIRTETKEGASVSFHVDTVSEYTMQIFLNDAYVGNRTQYVTPDGCISFEPVVGASVTHVQSQLYGTTPLEMGCRKTLILCKKINVEKDLLRWANDELAFYARVVSQLTNMSRDDHIRLLRYRKVTKSQSFETTIRFMQRVVEQMAMVRLDQQQDHLKNQIKNYMDFLTESTNNNHHRADVKEERHFMMNFIWYTHLQHRERYYADVLKHTGKIIHCVSLEEEDASPSQFVFEPTCSLS